jgi:hypothetical protein
MRAVVLLIGVMNMATMFTPAAAQDIAGVEDCTKTQGLDRRTGCLQSNVNFLQRTVTRNALEAHRRLLAADAEVAALKAALADLRKQVEQLRAERRPEPKPEPKKK